MRKRYLLIIPAIALLSACESDTPTPAVKVDVQGKHVRDIVLENKDIPLILDLVSDRIVEEDVHVILSLNGETTARVNEHFTLDKSTLQIAKGNSKAYGKLTILQENFKDGDEKKIRIDFKSDKAAFADTAYVVYNITMGAVRIPLPEYCRPVPDYALYAAINGFEFAGIKNTVLVANDGDYFPGSAVVNYTALMGEVVRGETYSYSVTPDWYKTGDGDIYEVVFFIDWNRDGDYGDEGEMILRREINKAGCKPQIGEITIPEDAVVGLVGMRVGFFPKALSDLDDSGCGTVDSGEFEDYALNIKETK